MQKVKLVVQNQTHIVCILEGTHVSFYTTTNAQANLDLIDWAKIHRLLIKGFSYLMPEVSLDIIESKYFWKSLLFLVPTGSSILRLLTLIIVENAKKVYLHQTYHGSCLEDDGTSR